MGKYLVEFTTKATKELRYHYRSGKRSNILKIEQILKELTENPFEGTGNPKPLKYNLAGYWSRRINKKDRIADYLFRRSAGSSHPWILSLRYQRQP